MKSLTIVAALLLSSLPASAQFGNATKFMGRSLCRDTPTDTQVYAWNAASSCWKPAANGGGGSGSLVLTSGSGSPSSSCTAPSSSNLAVYFDTTSHLQWWCSATDTWKKVLDTTGAGQYVVTGATGTAPSNPASGSVSCYFDSTSLTQVCLDTSGNAFTMVKGTTATSNQFVTNVDAFGIQQKARPACANLSDSTASCSTDATSATNITSGTLPIARIASAAITPGKMAASTFDVQTDAATVTWAIASVLNAQAKLTFTVHSGSRTLNITNPVIGGNYTLELIQDGTGGEGLTLGTGCTWKVINGGAGAVTPSTGAGAIDVLAFTYDGTNCLATFGKNYN